MFSNADVWAAAIWGPKQDKTSEDVCLCCRGLRAKPKGSRLGCHCGTPPHTHTPEGWESQGRVGKTFRLSSIKTLVTQMTRNNGAFSTMSPPCPTHLCHRTIGPRRTAPSTIGRLVPEWNRVPLLSNWVFVIARSIVLQRKKRTWKTVLWRRVAGRSGEFDGRHLKVPDALPWSIVRPYRGLRWF